MYKKLLAGSQDTYTAGKKAAESFFKPLPTADYKLQLAKHTMDTINTKNGVALIDRLQWLVLEGEFSKRFCFTTLFLTGEYADVNIHSFFMGMEEDAPADKTDLPAVMDDLVKKAPIVIAKIKETDEGFNQLGFIREVVSKDGSKAKPSSTSSSKTTTTKGGKSEGGQLGVWATQWGYDDADKKSDEEVIGLLRADSEKFVYADLDEDDKAMIAKYDLQDTVDEWPEEEKEVSSKVDEDLITFAKAWGYDEGEIDKCESTEALVELIRADDDNDGKPFPYADCEDDDKKILEEYGLIDKVDGWPSKKTKGRAKGKAKGKSNS
jgi:hypothetical protein